MSDRLLHLPPELVNRVADHLNADELGSFACISGGGYAVSKTNAMERAKVVVGGCERAKNADFVDKVDPSKLKRNLIILDAGECKAELQNKINDYCDIIGKVLEEERHLPLTDEVDGYYSEIEFTSHSLEVVEDRICAAAAGEIAELEIAFKTEDAFKHRTSQLLDRYNWPIAASLSRGGASLGCRVHCEFNARTSRLLDRYYVKVESDDGSAAN
jgi:hypothetical protein